MVLDLRVASCGSITQQMRTKVARPIGDMPAPYTDSEGWGQKTSGRAKRQKTRAQCAQPTSLQLPSAFHLQLPHSTLPDLPDSKQFPVA